ncbi:hypothetical protein GA0070623_3914 [Micromonospora rifamycinica]|uniref:Uncharacterized protein n=1 Tax=Micromonospora rifamycinica TaxID=291594 RepID=A0A1C5JVT7_9ACTN|nr:hypothetical protein GA0070623_3914 [Micromonospora rifamycinica]
MNRASSTRWAGPPRSREPVTSGEGRPNLPPGPCRRPGWPTRAQPVVQERIWGLAPLLPFIIVVKPKVLPLPLERIVIT